MKSYYCAGILLWQKKKKYTSSCDFSGLYLPAYPDCSLITSFWGFLSVSSKLLTELDRRRRVEKWSKLQHLPENDSWKPLDHTLTSVSLTIQSEGPVLRGEWAYQPATRQCKPRRGRTRDQLLLPKTTHFGTHQTRCYGGAQRSSLIVHNTKRLSKYA